MLRGIALISLLLIWCLIDVATPRAQENQLAIAIGWVSPAGLDPHMSRSRGDEVIASHVYEPLLRLSTDSELQPALAETWQTEGETWTFGLRQNVLFHDGSELRAVDAAASLLRLRALPPSEMKPALMNLRELITEIEIVDDFVLRVHTNGVRPELPFELVGLGILPESSLERQVSVALEPDRAIGTGPYALDDFDSAGGGAELGAFSEWWAGPPAWNRVALWSVPEPNDRFMMLEQGLVNVALDVPPELVSVFPQTAGFWGRSPGNLLHLQFANTAPSDSSELRLALSLALDRDRLSSMLQVPSRPAPRLLPLERTGVEPSPAFDPERARRLVEESGMSGGVSLRLGAEYRHSELVKMIGSMLNEVGIETDITLLGGGSDALMNGELDAALLDFDVRRKEASDALVQLVGTPGSGQNWGMFNLGGFGTPELDNLIEMARLEPEGDRRDSVLDEALDLAAETPAVVPIAFESTIVVALPPGLAFSDEGDGYALAEGVGPDDSVPVRVFYGTDRSFERIGGDFRYRSTRAGTLSTGSVVVTVPRTHEPGHVEQPLVTWLESFPWSFDVPFVRVRIGRPDPADEFVALPPQRQDEEVFLSEMQEMAARVPAPVAAYLFVHGFGNAFNDAAATAAQIAYDLGWRGLPIFYSWPSAGELSARAYRGDREDAEAAAEHFEKFLRMILKKSGMGVVHLIAHSLGNKLVFDVLENMATTVDSSEPKLFGEVVVIAPDVDVDQFRRAAYAAAKLARRISLYANGSDWALLVSEHLWGGRRRAGYSRPWPLTINGVDTIDATEVDNDLFDPNHRTALSEPVVLDDVRELLGSGLGPEARSTGLLSVVGPDGSFWRFPQVSR